MRLLLILVLGGLMHAVGSFAPKQTSWEARRARRLRLDIFFSRPSSRAAFSSRSGFPS